MKKNRYIIYLIGLVIAFCGCEPEAQWSEQGVEIKMSLQTVSAGFIECNFSTNKEAYYLIAIEEARPDFDPMKQQKQFMMLALDSANVQYLAWRNSLLREGEFNIAPFSSHALQYGAITHFFTGLIPDTDYWIYSFAVNPQTLKPVGNLNLLEVTTTDESTVDIHFEYRIKGLWDYIYPIDSMGNVVGHFPYIATTRDSLEYDYSNDLSVPKQLLIWMAEMFLEPTYANPYYGVQAIENDGEHSLLMFEEGHTYYTGICGFDGPFTHATIYKFKWEGEQTQLYFRDTDPANIMLNWGE